MPVYRYSHDCGFNGDQFLNQDKSSVVLSCARCGRNVTARQVRDKSAIIASNNEVSGVLRRNNGGNNVVTH